MAMAMASIKKEIVKVEVEEDEGLEDDANQEMLIDDSVEVGELIVIKQEVFDDERPPLSTNFDRVLKHRGRTTTKKKGSKDQEGADKKKKGIKNDKQEKGKQHKCTKCPKSFRIISLLRKHFEIHKKNRPSYKCSFSPCKKTFISKIGWKKHEAKFHQGLRKTFHKWPCYFCGVKTETWTSLVQHVGKHTLERPEKCPICKGWFKSLNGHKNTHLNNTYTCEVHGCGMVFKWKNDLKHHTKYVHEKATLERYYCSFPACEYSTVRFRDYKKHMDWIHLRNASHECSECGKKFGNKFTLRDHFLHHHTDESERRFPCSKCKKRFISAPSLKLHEKTHENGKGESYPCETCGKSYPRKSSLLTHKKRAHLGHRYSCYFCGHQTVTKTGIDKHMMDHTLERPYPCSQENCTKWFKSAEILKNHLYSFHSIGKSQTSRRENVNLECSYPPCPKKFRYQCDLKKHIAIYHTKTAPMYKCGFQLKNGTVCPYEAHSRGMIKSHKDRVHLNVTHPCPKCGKKYKKLYQMKQHVVREH